MRTLRQWISGLSIVLVAGCNMVTGAGDLRIEADGDGGAAQGTGTGTGTGGGSAATGSGSGSGSSSSGNGSTSGSGSGSGSGGGPIDAPTGYADGAAVTAVDLYQALRRPVVEGGQLASSNIPIVAGKPAMVRVFYQTDASYDGQPVTARLTLGETALEVQTTLGVASTHTDLNSTVNIDVPGDLLAAGANFKIELLQPAETVSGGNSAAAFPPDGNMAPLAVEVGAVKLKIMLVPVNNNGTLPDTSPTQVERYQRYFAEQYPVPSVDVSVRSTAFTYNGSLGSYNGWSDLLDRITDLRNTDNTPPDVYYYGIHNAQSGGLLGLGWVGGANDVWSRTAIGVGWTGNTAPETAVHELGHNHGRPHSPCGVSGDGNYPHSGARIGVWGYRPSDNKLLDPSQYVDFMSYCDPPWISDWTFRKIFERAKVVSTQPLLEVPEHLANRTYERIKVLDGQAFFKDTVVLPSPPLGEEKTVTVTMDGQAETLTGHYYAYNHIDGGVLLVMRPAGATATRFESVQFSAEGHAFTLTR